MKVDILMVVKNEEKCITLAVNSLLKQTHKNFNLYILDDASDDRTYDLLKSLAANEPRIVLLRNKLCKGLAAGLNKLIDLSSEEFIFRMDGDDISDARRIEKQLHYLQHNKDVDILGCNCRFINKDTKEYIGDSKVPSNNSSMLRSGAWNTWLIHPSVVFRRKVFNNYGKYNENLDRGQDSELWYRLVEHVNMRNLDDVLLDYSVKQNFDKSIFYKILKIKLKYLQFWKFKDFSA